MGTDPNRPLIQRCTGKYFIFRGNLIFSVYRFLWCQYCHLGQIQATNVMSLNSELSRDCHTFGSCEPGQTVFGHPFSSPCLTEAVLQNETQVSQLSSLIKLHVRNLSYSSFFGGMHLGDLQERAEQKVCLRLGPWHPQVSALPGSANLEKGKGCFLYGRSLQMEGDRKHRGGNATPQQNQNYSGRFLENRFRTSVSKIGGRTLF